MKAYTLTFSGIRKGIRLHNGRLSITSDNGRMFESDHSVRLSKKGKLLTASVAEGYGKYWFTEERPEDARGALLYVDGPARNCSSMTHLLCKEIGGDRLGQANYCLCILQPGATVRLERSVRTYPSRFLFIEWTGEAMVETQMNPTHDPQNTRDLKYF